MGATTNHRDLIAWQQAVSLVELIYRDTAGIVGVGVTGTGTADQIGNVTVNVAKSGLIDFGSRIDSVGVTTVESARRRTVNGNKPPHDHLQDRLPRRPPQKTII